MTAKTTVDASKSGILVINGKKFRGKIFQLPEQIVELYPVQALASAVNRTVHAVHLWERKGEIPKPLFRITSSSPLQEQRRYYSRVQIINLHQAHNRFPFSAGRPHLRFAFFALFNAVFDEGEIIDVAEIVVPTPHQPRIIRRRADHHSYERSSAPSAQSQSHRPVAPSFGHAPADDAQQTQRNSDQAESRRDTVEGHRGYPTDSHSRPQKKKPDYRRRPSGGV